MKKLLSILGTITLIGTASTSVIACENPKQEQIDLSTIIKTEDLGAIVIANDIATKTEILTAIQEKNTTANSLTVKDFEFKEGSPTATSATIIGIEKYKGEITLNYTKYTRIDLSTIIKTEDLGAIVIANDTPTKTEILTAIQEKNTTANSLTVKDFEFKEGSPTATSATIIGIEKYKGEITLNYTKDTRTNLNTITELTGLNITADINEVNDKLWNQIFQANEFKDLKYKSYETFMYKTNNVSDTTQIKDSKQEKGDIYVILQVGKNEGVNCFGDTPRLKVTLN